MGSFKCHGVKFFMDRQQGGKDLPQVCLRVKQNEFPMHHNSNNHLHTNESSSAIDHVLLVSFCNYIVQSVENYTKVFNHPN